MSDLKLFAVEFQGKPIHTLTVRDRPAWIALELGTILGYPHAGQRLQSKITGDWAEDFVAGQDYALLVGAELDGIKAGCDAVPAGAKGLLVLFESGLHLALVKAHLPLARRLRRFLVDTVLPLARAAYGDLDVSPELEIVTRGLRADIEDRRLRSRALRQTADALADLGRLDQASWTVCLIRSCEIALGRPLPLLYSALDRDWTDPETLAAQLDVPTRRVLRALTVLGLIQRATHVRPRPVRDGASWVLTFRLSPEAVALVEAWLAEQDEPPPPPALAPAA